MCVMFHSHSTVSHSLLLMKTRHFDKFNKLFVIPLSLHFHLFIPKFVNVLFCQDGLSYELLLFLRILIPECIHCKHHIQARIRTHAHLHLHARKHTYNTQNVLLCFVHFRDACVLLCGWPSMESGDLEAFLKRYVL